MFFQHAIISLAWVIFIFLVTVFFLLFSGMVTHGFTRYVLDRKRKEAKRFISDLIVNEVMEPGSQNLQLLKPYAGKVTLLKVLEHFSERFSGEEWLELREDIAISFLLPKARQLVNHTSWMNRNFAARCFVLAPLKYDLEDLLKLLDDPEFLVRCQAARALKNLKSPEAVYKMIEHMSDEPGYAHYYFRDMLLKMKSREVLEWIEEFGLRETKRFTKIACLDLLSGNSFQLTTRLLDDCLAADDEDLRYYATKVHARNPQKNSRSVLLKQMDDPDWKIREEAAYGMQYQYSNETTERLKKALIEDPVWKVKIGAARSLKKFGFEEMEILESIDETKSPEAKEAFQYAMNFG